MKKIIKTLIILLIAHLFVQCNISNRKDLEPSNKYISYKSFYDNGDLQVEDYCITSENHIASVGSVRQLEPIHTDFYINLFKENSEIIWSNQFGGSLSEKGFSIIEFQNSLFASGYGMSYNPGKEDIIITNFNKTNGKILWGYTYTGSGSQYSYSISPISLQEIGVTGWTSSFTGMLNAFYGSLNISSGDFNWVLALDSGYTDIGVSIFRPKVENKNYNPIIMTGWTFHLNPYSSIFAIRFEPSTSTHSWQKVIGGNKNDKAKDIIDFYDNLYLLAESNSFTQNNKKDILIIRLRISDGSLINAITLGTSEEESACAILRGETDQSDIIVVFNTESNFDKNLNQVFNKNRKNIIIAGLSNDLHKIKWAEFWGIANEDTVCSSVKYFNDTVLKILGNHKEKSGQSRLFFLNKIIGSNIECALDIKDQLIVNYSIAEYLFEKDINFNIKPINFSKGDINLQSQLSTPIQLVDNFECENFDIETEINCFDKSTFNLSLISLILGIGIIVVVFLFFAAFMRQRLSEKGVPNDDAGQGLHSSSNNNAITETNDNVKRIVMTTITGNDTLIRNENDSRKNQLDDNSALSGNNNVNLNSDDDNDDEDDDTKLQEINNEL